MNKQINFFEKWLEAEKISMGKTCDELGPFPQSVIDEAIANRENKDNGNRGST